MSVSPASLALTPGGEESPDGTSPSGRRKAPLLGRAYSSSSFSPWARFPAESRARGRTKHKWQSGSSSGWPRACLRASRTTTRSTRRSSSARRSCATAPTSARRRRRTTGRSRTRCPSTACSSGSRTRRWGRRRPRRSSARRRRRRGRRRARPSAACVVRPRDPRPRRLRREALLRGLGAANVQELRCAGRVQPRAERGRARRVDREAARPLVRRRRRRCGSRRRYGYGVGRERPPQWRCCQGRRQEIFSNIQGQGEGQGDFWSAADGDCGAD